MKHAIARIFRRISADEVRADQLVEAERLQVEHQAAGEMHSALAAVYRMRADRLRRELAGASVAQLHPVTKEPKPCL